MVQIFNHHSASVLPYHVDAQGTLRFVTEQKDPQFKEPFFNAGHIFQGGNFEKGIHFDKSPLETLEREVREEYWLAFEDPRSLNDLHGQEFMTREPNLAAKYEAKSIARIKRAVPILLNDVKHANDYSVTVNPPIVKAPQTYGATVFVKELSTAEFGELEALIKEFDGRLTTDNLKWGSRISINSVRDLNSRNEKFAWGYDKIINDLLKRHRLPQQPFGIVREMTLVNVEELNYWQEQASPGVLTYALLEKSGYQYLDKKKK